MSQGSPNIAKHMHYCWFGSDRRHRLGNVETTGRSAGAFACGNYHWPNDVAANVDFDTVANGVRLSEAVVRRLDEVWF